MNTLEELQSQIKLLRSENTQIKAQLSQLKLDIKSILKVTESGFKESKEFTESVLPENISERDNYELFGMTYPLEQKFVNEYAKTKYLGTGEIVELGCFLGSFSIQMAKGLQENSQVRDKSYRINSYDIFICDDYVVNYFFKGTNLDGKYEIGDSFLDEYLSRIKEYEQYIKVHNGDLAINGWDGRKIEFLLIDAMKSWELANSIQNIFFPCLVPGESFIMHQDFSHYYTYWIPLLMYHFRDCFETIDFAPASSVIFKYIKSISKEKLESTYSLDSFKKEYIYEAYEYFIGILPLEMQANLLAAKVMACYQLKDKKQGLLEIERGKSLEKFCYYSELNFAKQYIDFLE